MLKRYETIIQVRIVVEANEYIEADKEAARVIAELRANMPVGASAYEAVPPVRRA